MEKALAFARKNSSLKWYDYLYYRVMERFKGVNEASIDAGDMEDLLKKNEYLDMQDFIQDAQQKDIDRANQKLAAAKKIKGS